MKAGRTVAVLLIVGLVLGTPWSTPTSAGARAARGSHHPATSGPTLNLIAPPTIAGPASPFTLRLSVSGDASPAALSVSITVYEALSTPTAFAETLGGSPVGSTLARSGAIPWTSLSHDPDSPNGVDLSVPVTAGGVAGAGTGPFAVDLHCPLGSCGGVYPVQLELTDTVSHTTSRLLSYLAYTEPSADTEPLRLALVVPLSLPATNTSPGGTVAGSSLTGLIDLMDAISGPRATVPLTLAPSPATLVALHGDLGAKARSALSSLVALTAESDRQSVCGSFAPVNASSVVTEGADGTTELVQQVRRGAQVLATIAGLHSACTTTGAWVSDTTLDDAALSALGSLGYDDTVVPPSAVAGPALATTPTRRFTWVGEPRTATGILSDPPLSSLLDSTSGGDPALVADQLLAELEFDYTEAPYAPGPRGVVVAPPAGEPADPAVLSDVLDGLQGNPMVAPVTLATLFSQVSVGGTVGRFSQPSPRRPAVAAGPTGPPASAIAAARHQWVGFAAAVSGSSTGTAVATSLDDLLLESESLELTPAGQRAALSRFDGALHGQLALLSVTSRDVRLTARTGNVPITVVKTAPYPVEAILTVTSDKIAFSTGGSQIANSECRTPVVTTSAGRSSESTRCTFVHGTNAVYIEMRSRVSGDFRMQVTLTSPRAGLGLASGQLTVRSMSTSAAAIALSVAAVAVLLFWWGRTLWRNRRTRRGAHRAGAGGS